MKGSSLYPMVGKIQGQGHKTGEWQSWSQVKIQLKVRSLGYGSAYLLGGLLVPKSSLTA